VAEIASEDGHGSCTRRSASWVERDFLEGPFGKFPEYRMNYEEYFDGSPFGTHRIK
jgi:hypothetical protein